MRTRPLLLHLGALSYAFGASVRLSSFNDQSGLQKPMTGDDGGPADGRTSSIPATLDRMLDALSVMQDTYYDLHAGTWIDAIDWTAAVIGTHISASLSGLVNGLTGMSNNSSGATCGDELGWENTINKYFAQTSVFYFSENAFGLRNQAYDDMLWVVLGWLENIKFAEMYTRVRWKIGMDGQASWHGLQFSPLTAHRARIFYELAERGWDERLCAGGMVWNPQLEPYKNSITNELFAAASIAMYLYHPGDNDTSPFMVREGLTKPHDPRHLGYAIKAYKWMQDVGLTNDAGLYQDGYHITGWHKYRNGTIDPGTRVCDSLDSMVYTYNQGVLLSASRGLWIATGRGGYLEDGHQLVQHVMRATGWPNKDRYWKGLGRGGVLEEFCDQGGYCSQDGQTFKGIFFHHLTEFCRPLWAQEEELIISLASSVGFDKAVYKMHMQECAKYGPWIKHNADAALMTRNDDGLFGMWWGVPIRPSTEFVLTEGKQQLPDGATDWRNPSTTWKDSVNTNDMNDRGRGRTVESQSGGLAVLRARWQWDSLFN